MPEVLAQHGFGRRQQAAAQATTSAGQGTAGADQSTTSQPQAATEQGPSKSSASSESLAGALALLSLLGGLLSHLLVPETTSRSLEEINLESAPRVRPT